MAIPIERLDEMLEEQQEVKPGFKIDSLELAVWADEKVRDAELKCSEIDHLTDDRIAVLQSKIDKLNEWREEAKKPYQGKIDFFKGHLMNYLADQVMQGIKSVKLPFRALQSRTQQPEIKKDDQALLEWAKENAADFVEHKPSLKWAEYKKTLSLKIVDGHQVYIDTEGQVVPHITITERPVVLDWKVSE